VTARSSAPLALIVDTGLNRDDRPRMILEAWRHEVHSGRDGGVQYDCARLLVQQESGYA
jgi:hypothetical protein